MDSKSDKPSQGFPGNSLAMVLVLAASALVLRTPLLESSRPATPEPRLEVQQAGQDIDARLWQDPFGAVARAREQAAKQPTADAREAVRRQHARLGATLAQATQGAGRVVVLGVMVPSGSYSDQSESRRRMRHAVLAGLNARRYTPLDTEHLGYVTVPAPRHGNAPAATMLLPYEWFVPGPDTDRAMNDTAPAHDCRACKVLLLWLDEDAFRDRPVAGMVGLLQWLQRLPGPALPPRRLLGRVLGPMNSDALDAMVHEVMAPTFDPGPLRPVVQGGPPGLDLRFYAAVATVPDSVLLANLKWTHPDASTVHELLQGRHVELLRTIGDDAGLARALTVELGRRGLRTTLASPRHGPANPVPDKELCRNERDPAVDAPDGKPRGPSHIAIVAEWDSLYGRSMRRHFELDTTEDPNDPDAHAQGFCVRRWHYVRGLDGRLPGDASAGTGAGDKPRKAEGAGKAPAGDEAIERPEGQGQFDYLRRLGQRIVEQDRVLRRKYGDQQGIRAVGVLGSDVYDKLLVLQALQPQLPNAIFFTTDLDARLFHPAELKATRNLIVASSFGLQLLDRLQGGSAPFRDSYQTGLYFTTQLALLDAHRAAEPEAPPQEGWSLFEQARVSQWFEQPRLFEISRSGYFDYSPAPAASAPASSTPPGGGRPALQARGPSLPMQQAQAASPEPTAVAEKEAASALACRWRQLERCADIHPPPSKAVPDVGRLPLFLVLSALVLLAWLPPVLISRSLRRRLRRFVRRGSGAGQRAARRGALLTLLALLQLGLPGWLTLHAQALGEALTEQGTGKPLVLLDGISPWPTHAIRLFTLVLCVYLVLLSWSSLVHNLDRLSVELDLGGPRRRLMALQRRIEQNRGWAYWFKSRLELRFHREHSVLRPSRWAAPAAATRLTGRCSAFWMHYVVRNRSSGRLLRSSLGVAAMLALCAVLTTALGGDVGVPQRGRLSLPVHQGLVWLTLVAALFLVFFVVDATLLCVFFVRGLNLHRINWPPQTLAHFQRQMNLPRTLLDDWIDLQFVARRTACVGQLIYYPFIVLSLLLLSSSVVFDDWHVPTSMAVVAGLSAALLMACAVLLRRAADHSRELALRRARDEQLLAQAQGGQLQGQLALLIQRIEALQEGAFLPFWRQPLLKALLLPFATVGGTTLLDTMALLNL